MSDAARLLVGNLDVEAEFALEAARARSASPSACASLVLPEELQARLAAVATLLRAFAREDDVLLLGRAVGEARVLAVEGLPRPHLACDASSALGILTARNAAPHGGRVALTPWSSAPSIDALRARIARTAPDAGGAASAAAAAAAADVDAEFAGDRSQPLWLRLRHAPRSPADVQRRTVERAFAHALERRFGSAPAGARLVHGWDELVEHLASGGADASPTGQLVLKPSRSAAGRGHVLLLVTEVLEARDASLRRRIERLLAAHGALLCEPWLARRADLGQAGLVLAERVDLLPPHRLLTDARGRFTGIEVGPPGAAPPDLDAEHAAGLARVGRRVGEALAEIGFRGPFAVDAFVARDAAGDEGLRPLVELNPRLSFGLVAHALAERVPAARNGMVLHLGRSVGEPPAGALGLLARGDDDDTIAWLEPSGGAAGERAVGTPRGGTRGRRS